MPFYYPDIFWRFQIEGNLLMPDNLCYIVMEGHEEENDILLKGIFEIYNAECYDYCVGSSKTTGNVGEKMIHISQYVNKVKRHQSA